MSTIHLGAILSLTGEASQDAQGIRNGVELAVRTLREQGREITLHYLDDQSDVVTSVRAIDSLIREYNISAIIGPTWAHQVDSFAPIIDQEKIVTFAPAVASDSIIRHSEYLLFGAEKNLYKQSALEDFIKSRGIKKIGAILSQDKWGVSHLLPIQRAAQQTGAKIVFVEQLIPYISAFGQKYLRETISHALDAHPDVLIWSGYEGEADVLVDSLLEHSLSIPLIGDQMLVAGARGEKLKHYTGDLYIFSNRFSPEFTALFSSVYGRGPTLYSDIAYDATLLLIDALTTNPAQSSEQLMTCIKGKEYQYQGLSGTFAFDGMGDIQQTGRWVIEQFEK
jgi:ABC-type branched-subunit amino acid transport system substrate-binding protein